MKKFYVIRHSFWDLILQYPNLFQNISTQQRCDIIEKIDVDEMKASAVSYFQQDIMEEQGKLYLKHSVMEDTYCITCYEDGICFDHEQNPFYTLLKRKYRHFLIQEC